jgi:hypothetical protein
MSTNFLPPCLEDLYLDYFLLGLADLDRCFRLSVFPAGTSGDASLEDSKALRRVGGWAPVAE